MTDSVSISGIRRHQHVRDLHLTLIRISILIYKWKFTIYSYIQLFDEDGLISLRVPVYVI